jgi:hypothetical protein
MRKELKQKREQKTQELSKEVYNWKENLKEKYRERFPKPKLDRPTDDIIEKDQTDITAQSTKTTRLILKFWLIGLAIVTL